MYAALYLSNYDSYIIIVGLLLILLKLSVSTNSGCSRGYIRCYGFLIGPPDPVSNIRPTKSEQPGSNEAVRHTSGIPSIHVQNNHI